MSELLKRLENLEAQVRQVAFDVIDAEWHRVSGYQPYGSPVPGVGPLMGVKCVNGEVFAYRANEDGNILCWKASQKGWVIP